MHTKIGLFGGTFDPPHNAHLMIAQEALTVLNLDEIWFIPVYSPPHKTREYMAHPDERLQMTQKAIADNPQFQVSTMELERKGPSYTLETVDSLKEAYPQTSFYFIIGGDMAEQLHLWKDIEKLKELVTFAVIDRPGYSIQPIDLKEMKYINMPQVDISSSMIRERHRLGKNIRYYIPDSVWAFIKEKNIYG
ncbi:nicotinate-nucleotide adenylyltransferase [Salibacterium salarium]|uniref:Probable nicotinate-nucleotide adenylyltransferase n=2 Tax=Salibacterium salarium TaxID=284579 RepID=A0A428MZJ9_9BACI|nr:nicotinate-nucleotide adenylyltransferase [Salibacterium salarium]